MAIPERDGCASCNSLLGYGREHLLHEVDLLQPPLSKDVQRKTFCTQEQSGEPSKITTHQATNYPLSISASVRTIIINNDTSSNNSRTSRGFNRLVVCLRRPDDSGLFRLDFQPGAKDPNENQTICRFFFLRRGKKKARLLHIVSASTNQSQIIFWFLSFFFYCLTVNYRGP